MQSAVMTSGAAPLDMCAVQSHASCRGGGCPDPESGHPPIASAGAPHKGLHCVEALRLPADEGHEQAQRS
jgi:hypothetical protein